MGSWNPTTETGYNMFEMLSVVQKAVRRGDYELGGWGCEQLRGKYRNTMWNRLLITTSEDCFGVLTKEIVALWEKDQEQKDDKNVADAMALLCRARKSRDACYFACNFVIDTRKPREIKYTPEQASDYVKRLQHNYDQFGFEQESMFEEEKEPIYEWGEKEENGLCLQIAIDHRDMDMMGWHLDQLRNIDWSYIWEVYMDYAQTHFDGALTDEIEGLRRADMIFNAKRNPKNEIFISKALMIFCYASDPRFASVKSSDFIQYHSTIDWTNIKVKPIKNCQLKDNTIPDFVFDCHTIKGKQRGKTDWDMTRDEQEALFPLEENDYFSHSSWIYTYEQDYREGRMTEAAMLPIRTYAMSHPANPVEFIPYD